MSRAAFRNIHGFTMVMESQVRFSLLILALPFRFGSNTDEACRVLPNWKREFIEMLGVVF